MKNNEVKVLFKYIGGKTWMKDIIRKSIKETLKNNNINTFIEPFAGGLGCFLNIYDLLIEHNVKNIILNDINKKIINFYKFVYQSPQILINEYECIEKEFIKLIPYNYIQSNNIKDKEKIKELLAEANHYFLNIRNKFNSSSHDDEKAAALFLFLQTHCFNGVYRENQKGNYNTPFNWGVKKFDKEKTEQKILKVHNIFRNFNIDFTNKSYNSICYNIENSLYYADPPYINNDDEIKENKYHKDGFNIKDQLNLIKLLSPNNFIYSNHDNSILLEEFKKYSNNIKIKRFSRKNIMSASKESRKQDKKEILVSHIK